MAKVYCAAIDCAYNNDNGVCTAKKVSLGWQSVNTFWEGRQEYNKCKTYQRDHRWDEFDKSVTDFLKRNGGRNDGQV